MRPNGLFTRFALAAAFAGTATLASAQAPVAPKVMVITMFGGEAKPWLEGRKLETKIKVPGLSAEYPEISCEAEDLCVMTTAMGFANAASSVSAMVLSGQFDLTSTYFIIAGIAGVDPSDGTLGSAHWARYSVDAGLRHEIDPRQVDAEWPHGILALGAKKPGEKPTWGSKTEVYQLNETLLQKAFAVTKDVELADNDDAAAFRANYPQAPANAKPLISICDTLSTDTYWHGTMIAEAMADWVSLLTDDKGNYCTTQMEDNATLTALTRGAEAGLLDFNRIAVLRTGSNFDREPPSLSPAESLATKSGGFQSAAINAYRVGATLADEVIGDWTNWEKGVPEQ